MKKSIIAVLLCVTFVTGFAGCRKKTSEEAEMTTNATGETETVEAGFFQRLVGADAIEETTEAKTEVETVTDKKGEAVTNKKGDAVTTVVKVTEEEKISLNEEEASIFKKKGINIDNFEERDTEVVTMALEEGLVTETTSVKKDVKVVGGVPANSPSKTFKDILATGTYTMEATIASGDTTVPIKVYVDGQKYAISTKMKTGALTSVKADFLNDGKNVYLILPSLRCYINAGSTQELMGDTEAVYAITDPTVMQGKGADYVKSATVVIDGKTYDVEEYKTESETLKYYYFNNDLKRIEDITESDGTSTIIDLTVVKEGVPSNAFSVPAGYIDMTEVFNSGSYEGIIEEATETETTTAA